MCNIKYVSSRLCTGLPNANIHQRNKQSPVTAESNVILYCQHSVRIFLQKIMLIMSFTYLTDNASLYYKVEDVGDYKSISYVEEKKQRKGLLRKILIKSSS